MDLAQDVFVRAYMSLGTLKEPDKFGAWLTGIAANVCRMYLRKPREVAVSTDVMEQLGGSIDPVSDTDASIARQIIDSLPNGTRSAAVLFFVEGMRQAEIAEFLEISVSAVKARIRDAKARLHKEMIHMTRRAVKPEEPGDEFNINLKHKLELTRYYREFSELIDCGTSLVRSLAILEQGDYSEAVRQATYAVRSSVESGSLFSDALAQQPILLTPEAVRLMYAGEIGGTLEISFRALANCIEAQNVVSDVEACYWCRTLGELFSSGVGLLSALDCGAQIASNPLLKRLTGELADAWTARKPAQSVLQRYVGAISPVVIVAITAGERSERLDFALTWAAEELAVTIAQRLAPSGVAPGGVSAPDDAFLKEVASMLSDESPAIRATAAQTLGRFSYKQAELELVELISDSNTEVRKAAIKALAEMNSQEVASKVAECLADPNAAVRRTAVEALVMSGSLDAPAAIAGALFDADQRVAGAVISGLESMGEIDVLVNTAIQMLDADDWFLLIRATGILREHKSTEAVEKLCALLQTTANEVDYPQSLAAKEAALTLGRMGCAEALPMLLRMMTEPNHWWAGRAAEALVYIGDPTAAPHIRRAIEEGKLDPSFISLAERLENQ